jgi:hypothetical protein
MKLTVSLAQMQITLGDPAANLKKPLNGPPKPPGAAPI